MNRWALGLAGLIGGCARGEPPEAGMGPIAVASSATARGATPSLMVTPAGDRVLSWVADDSATGQSSLFVQVTRAGGEPGPAVGLRDSLGSVEPHGEAPPQVVVMPSGVIYALYTVGKEVARERFPRSALRFARSDDWGRIWSEPTNVNEGEKFGSHNFHALLAGPSHTVYAAWLSSVRGVSGVWLRRSIDGGRTWKAASSIYSSEACPCCRTGLALGPDGSLYVSWRAVLEGSVRDVVVMRSPDGGERFDPPVRPREDGWVFNGCPHAGPALAVDSAGGVHVAWWTGKAGEAGVYYARSDDGGRGFEPVPIAVGERAAPAHVKLAVGRAGVVVVWDDGHSEVPRILARASTTGREFGPERQISTGGAATFPVLSLDGDTVTVAWSQTTDAAFRASMAARPDMKDPNAVMRLPRVGQSEILIRQVAVSSLLPASGAR